MRSKSGDSVNPARRASWPLTLSPGSRVARLSRKAPAVLRKLVAVTALAIALPVSAAPLAYAEPVSRVTIIDARGDMWRMPQDGPPLVAAPRQRRGDIRRTTIRHGVHAFNVRTQFSELARRLQYQGFVIRVRTNAGVRRYITIAAGKFGPRTFWRGFVSVERPNGPDVDCAAAHRINYTTNVIRLRVPRSCLNDPQWVQANVISLGEFGRPAAQSRAFFDNAHGPNRRLNDWSRRLHRP